MAEKRPPRVVIVGAGVGGISAGIALRRKLRLEQFTIYEKAASVGGTWRDNTYPGCGCDVPAHWYSHSTHLTPSWHTPYATQPELQVYWTQLFHKYGLERFTQFRTAVQRAVWKNNTQSYTITLRDETTGGETTTEAEVLIWAVGGFMSPKFPKELEGVGQFKGLVWHSAQWRHDFDLRGKRVGVIGNGCSAAQFIPVITEDPSVQVTNFCRTPQWYADRDNTPFPSWARWIFAHVPLVMRWYRNLIFASHDIRFFLAFSYRSPILGRVRKEFMKYLVAHAPPDQLEKLTPKYPPGCKRIIVDPGYLDCLKRSNVKLKWDLIKSFVSDGVVLTSGEHVPLDVIIFGTGYSIDPVDMHIKGTSGTYHEFIKSQGGPTAYLGTVVPGFPNLFTILGPNVATGHASAIFSEEVQIDFAIDYIRPIIQGKAKSFEIKQDVHDKYNNWLQRNLKQTVWTQCHSYYQADGNPASKIIATFPGPVTLFWYLAKTSPWHHWKVVGGERWVREQKWKKIRMWLLCATLAVSILLGRWYKPRNLFL